VTAAPIELLPQFTLDCIVATQLLKGESYTCAVETGNWRLAILVGSKPCLFANHKKVISKTTKKRRETKFWQWRCGAWVTLRITDAVRTSIQCGDGHFQQTLPDERSAQYCWSTAFVSRTYDLIFHCCQPEARLSHSPQLFLFFNMSSFGW